MQQRQQAVVEEVQERRAYAHALAVLIGQAVQVVARQWGIGAVQAEERRLYVVVGAGASRHALGHRHVGRGKAQACVAAQAHTLALGLVAVPGFQVVVVQAVQLLQQPEEVVVLRIGQQAVR
ncbi:hypothetical protein D3C72_1257050 [compost metagenome]